MWKNVHVAIRPPLTQKLALSSITESRGSRFFPSLSLVGDSRRKISSPVAEASETCAVSDEAESSLKLGMVRTVRLERAGGNLILFFVIL